MKMSWIKRLWLPKQTQLVPDAMFWFAMNEILDFVYQVQISQAAEFPCDSIEGPMLDSILVLEDWLCIAQIEGWCDDAPTQSRLP
jgi:hypothetical protein